MRWISLAAGILTFLTTGALFAILGTETPFGSPAYLMLSLCSNLVGWSWLFTIFGFGLGRLNIRTPLLDYANEAVLPFYILHQTVMLTIGFYAVNWLIPDLVKWIVILLGTFVICMALYESLIRRINLLRFLFGMKPLPRPQPATQPAAQQV